MIHINFEGFTDINGNEKHTVEQAIIKTDSVISFSYDGGRFDVSIDDFEIYNNTMADNDFSIEIKQESKRKRKDQGVVVELREFEAKKEEKVQSDPKISIDGNSEIIFCYDKNRLEVYICGVQVIKTTMGNDFYVDIYNV